ncbi:MAG TPA: tetratricopeptide repeat protein [Thermoanaerobaculia bacterium]|nr:tetratricopeptide repeat protein [Thermoanaerobaculia bacterium]
MESEQASRLMVLLFTDVVGSVDKKSRLGVAAYSRLISRHDALFRQSLAPCPDAEINKDTGDGFLAHFERVDSAVGAALRFVQALRAESWGLEPLEVRVGLHSGQVEVLPDEGGAPPKLVGLPVDLAARIMGLALPGQILVSRNVFDDARQYLREHPPAPGLAAGHALEWRAHGSYLFKGQDEPLPVFEVGAAGLAPLSPPPDSEKARRDVPPGEEPTLGWRPAVGLPIPFREGWELVGKVGEGGFGEAWLGRNSRTRTERIFKFCFDAERLRSFKRELTLFRLLRSALGERGDIARLFEVQLDEPPYFLESEYSEHGSLSDWAARQGGIDRVPLAVRLDLVARTATALGSAHDVGVLHKDLKPSNLLIYLGEDGQPRPRLADFGIGVLTGPSRLAELGITVTGFTETLLAGNESSRTGTRIYAPPETLAGKPFTIQGDIYALGVLLYQLVVGDLGRPLAVGWERQVDDELLREDIRACVHGDPQERLGSAHELAERLRALPQRRRRAEAERRRRVQQVRLRWGLGAAAVLALLLGVGFVSEQSRRRQVERERDKATRVTGILQSLLSSSDPRLGLSREATVEEALGHWEREAEASFVRRPEPAVEAAVRDTLGLAWKNLGRYDQAEPQLRKALGLRRRLDPADPLGLADSLLHLGGLLVERGDPGQEAEALLQEALALARRHGPADSPRLAECLETLGACYTAAGRFEEAEPLLEQGVELAEKLVQSPEGRPEDPKELNLRLAHHVNDLAGLHIRSGRLEKAAVGFRRALELFRQVEPRHPDTANALNNLAFTLEQQGRGAEAEPAYREALALRRELLGDGHPAVANSLGNLARLLAAPAVPGGGPDPAREAEADRLLTEAERILAAAGGSPGDAAINLSLHAQLLAGRGRRTGSREDLARAERLFGEAEAMLRRLPDGGGQSLAGTLLNRAGFLKSKATALSEPVPTAAIVALLCESIALYRALPEGARDGLQYALDGLGRVTDGAGEARCK